MARKSKKKAAQLDREIVEAIAKAPTRRAAWRGTPAYDDLQDAWNVATDAILMEDPAGAVQIWHDIHAEFADVMTEAPLRFSKALQDAPAEVRWKFDKLVGGAAITHIAAIYDVIYRSKDRDMLIGAVRAAKRYVAKHRRGVAFDPDLYNLRDALFKAEDYL